MQEKLSLVQNILTNDGLDSRLVRYEYFDANLIPELREAALFDFPVMLFFPQQSVDGINPVVVFDVRDEQFHVLNCQPVWKPDHITHDVASYSTYLIKPALEIYASDQGGEHRHYCCFATDAITTTLFLNAVASVSLIKILNLRSDLRINRLGEFNKQILHRRRNFLTLPGNFELKR